MSETPEKPAYWAVIPAAVRYDPELPASAKLLYAEISSLTNETGFCYAANKYFQELDGLSERTVQGLLRQLRDRGYIRIADGAGGADQRKIFAGINPLAGTPAENCGGPPQKIAPPPAENCGGDNVDINRKSIRPPKAPQGAAWEPELFERFWRAYPCHKDKASARREWDRLKPDRKLMRTMSAALDRAKSSDEWQRGIGIPYACRWISKRRWEDEPDMELREETAEPERRLVGGRC